MVDFARWQPLRPPSDDGLSRRIAGALARRDALWGVSDAFRLVDDAADGIDGIKVERFGDWGVVETYDVAAYERRHDVANALVELGARGVYLKVRERRGAPSNDIEQLAPTAPIAGSQAPESFVIVEHGRRHEVRLGDGLSTGLFVDQRENRVRVSELAQGRRVLNLFCYTGSFTVAAAAGGAASSVSVDLAARALKRVAGNLELNRLSGAHRLIREDVLRWLPRALRRGDRYDLIVVDPPSFARRGKNTFSVERDLGKLVGDALRLLDPRGVLLAVINHRRTPSEQLQRTAMDAARAAGVEIRDATLLPPALDCAPIAGGEAATKSVLVTTR